MSQQNHNQPQSHHNSNTNADDYYHHARNSAHQHQQIINNQDNQSHYSLSTGPEYQLTDTQITGDNHTNIHQPHSHSPFGNYAQPQSYHQPPNSVPASSNYEWDPSHGPPPFPHSIPPPIPQHVYASSAGPPYYDPSVHSHQMRQSSYNHNQHHHLSMLTNPASAPDHRIAHQSSAPLPTGNDLMPTIGSLDHSQPLKPSNHSSTTNNQRNTNSNNNHNDSNPSPITMDIPSTVAPTIDDNSNFCPAQTTPAQIPPKPQNNPQIKPPMPSSCDDIKMQNNNNYNDNGNSNSNLPKVCLKLISVH